MKNTEIVRLAEEIVKRDQVEPNHECPQHGHRMTRLVDGPCAERAREIIELAKGPAPDFMGDKEPVTNYCPVCEARSKEQGWVSDIQRERERQDAKWGEQNHDPFLWTAILGEEFGEACQAALQPRFGGKTLDDYRKELIEVAAVAVQAVECLDRGKWSWPSPPETTT